MDVSTAGIFTAASLDRPGMTCIAVIAHDWLCLRSDVSTTSHLILHWVLLLEQPDKTLAWSMDLDLCIVFGDSCRSPGFQALQDIQELHSASHLAMSHHQQLPPKGRTRPHSLDIGVYEHQDQREAAKQPKGRGVYKAGSGTFMFASTSMSAALDNLQFYPKVRCFHVLTIACLAAWPTPSTSI